jgi:miniconductance mechanosensitive channel
MKTLEDFNEMLVQSPALYSLTALVLIASIAFVSNLIVKKILIRLINHALHLIGDRNDVIIKHGLIARLANIIPAVVVIVGIELVPDLNETIKKIIHNVASAFIILSISRALSALLNMVNSIYTLRPNSYNKPIKGYIQLIKIALALITAILIMAALIDRSPLILLSGLGAITAVLMLVFQDTLLSLVASIQISSSDMLRVGDWIEMPQLNADGNVIDIALHTVKVQNWDKTITTLPTRRLINDPFKNWRGMTESGGRRVKRALNIDQNSIHFLTDKEKYRLKKFRLLQDYMEQKEKEIAEWNNSLSGDDIINTRRLTNIGTFRAYVEQYLRRHPGINQGMTLMVRQLGPTDKGLPLEIYCFTSNTSSIVYESIQADIFDHLYAIMPEFGLRAYQAQTDYGASHAV